MSVTYAIWLYHLQNMLMHMVSLDNTRQWLLLQLPFKSNTNVSAILHLHLCKCNMADLDRANLHKYLKNGSQVWMTQ